MADPAPGPGRPRQRARELALEADRLQFGLGEIDAVAPQLGEDEALVADIRRLSELDALRDAAQTARVALSGELDEPAQGAVSAVDWVGQAKAALQATDDAVLRALGDRLGEALAIVGDVAGRTRRLSWPNCPVMQALWRPSWRARASCAT